MNSGSQPNDQTDQTDTIDSTETLPEEYSNEQLPETIADQPPEEFVKTHPPKQNFNGILNEQSQKLSDLQQLHGDIAWSNVFMQSSGMQNFSNEQMDFGGSLVQQPSFVQKRTKTT